MMKKIFIFSVLAVVFLGCQQLTPSRVEEEPVVSVRPLISGPLLAQVGDWAIGVDDFENRLDVIRLMYPEVGHALGSEVKKQVLQELVNMQILAEAAKERGLHRDRDVKSEVNNFKRQLLAEKLSEEIARDIVVTDTEIRSFYEMHQVGFREPEERRIRELAVRSEREARDVLIRLLEGESFSSIAREVSLLESAGRGGDLGYIRPDPAEKFERFWEVAFITEKGETSGRFVGPDGYYYIIEVEDVRGGEVRTLSEVRSDIREFLRGQKMTEMLEDIISEAKRDLRVVINQNLLD